MTNEKYKFLVVGAVEKLSSVYKEENKLDIFDDVKTCFKEDAIKKELFSCIGQDINQEYLKTIMELSLSPNIAEDISDFKIVYTPLHGIGLMPIERALKMLGYNDLHIVEFQKFLNGDFPTVKSPNTEVREALTEGIKLSENLSADIVLRTDPDSNRVGVAVRNRERNYELLTGNQISALLTHCLISKKRKQLLDML